MQSLAEYYNLHWTLEGNILRVALEGFGAEWVGFSFAEVKDSMFPADAVIGWLDVNGPEVLPYRIVTQSVFAEDKDSIINLVDVDATQNSEKTIIRFTRSLSQGRVRVNSERDTLVNFAIGDIDSLRYHGVNRGQTTVVFDAKPLAPKKPAETPSAFPSVVEEEIPLSSLSSEAPASFPEAEESIEAPAPASIDGEEDVESLLDSLD